jgi:hypothetical protein
MNDPRVCADGAMPTMPLVRYFVFVGGALLALLFVADAYAPKSAAVTATETANTDNPTLRIRTDRKWPERVVFDTSIPTIVPALVATDASASAPAKIADVTAGARVRNSFAQFTPPETIKPESKAQKIRKIARIAQTRAAPPTRLAAQQPRFGFFGNDTW